MANVKISQLTPKGANLESTDLLEISEFDGSGYVTRSITGQEIIDAASGGGVAWGDITGTLSSQTDLQSELDGKFDVPTGDTTQYLDGAGTPTTFPTFASADKMVTVGRNSTGATLYKGTIVYISGSTGNRPNFVKAQANSEATSAGTFGVIEADIPNNSDGNCVTIGTIDNLDTRVAAPHPFTTNTLLDGDTIYLSPTTAGYVTNVKPSAPNHMVYVGKVVQTSPTNGTIVYRIQNGYELNEIHDVAITSIADNDIIQYDSSTSLWKNESLSTAGIQPTLVSGTSIKTVNSTSLLGSGDVAVQPTLVSGTNIKTINGNDVLGSGDLTISGGGGLQGVHSILPLYSGEITAANIIPYASISGSAFVADRMTAYPYIPNQNITTAALLMSCNAAVAGSSCRIYIYSNSTTSNYPDALLFTSSDLSTATTGVKYAITTFNFVAGTIYWLVFHGGTVAGAAHNMAVGYMMPIKTKRRLIMQIVGMGIIHLSWEHPQHSRHHFNCNQSMYHL